MAAARPPPAALLTSLVTPGEGRIVIKNVRLFTGDEVIISGGLIVKSGRITAVLRGDQADVEPVGEKDLVFDGHGEYTLLPGEPNMIDVALKMHTPELSIRASVFAGKTLAAGFTSVRDLGSIDYIGVGLRKMIDEGVVPGPHIITAGQGLAMTGGHADLPVHPCVCVDDRSRFAMTVDSPDEMRKAARTQMKFGVDVLKLIATGGVMTPGSQIAAAQLNVDEMEAAVTEARKAGKRTAAHAIGTQGIINALKAGITTIEHGCCVDQEGIELLVSKGAFLVPTLCAPYHISKSVGLPAFVIEKTAQVIGLHKAGLAKAHKAGVKIAMGTDSGTPFNVHGKNAKELELMVDCGLTPTFVLQTATKIATEAMGVEHDRGTLRVGLRADLLLVRGDPTVDVTVLQDLARLYVFKSGKLVAAHGHLTYPSFL